MPWVPVEYDEEDMRQFESAYRGKIKYLVDENMGPDVAAFLRDSGYNAKFVSDYGMCGHPDENVFALAWREKRVVLTHDDDYFDDRKFPPHRNPGVIRIVPGADGKDTGAMVRCLVLSSTIAGKNASWYVGKKIDFVSPEHITIVDRDGAKTRFMWPTRGRILMWEE